MTAEDSRKERIQMISWASLASTGLMFVVALGPLLIPLLTGQTQVVSNAFNEGGPWMYVATVWLVVGFMVITIGSAETHKLVLENPDMISKRVLDKGLDAGTAYEILSIDIADVDVGKNIGAELETDRAEADKKIAQAKAEERRAMAFAVEQEMKARVEEMRAKVVEAEAQVPLAMAHAFKEGNLGIMDYYRMKNIEADTHMRDTIGTPEKKPE